MTHTAAEAPQQIARSSVEYDSIINKSNIEPAIANIVAGKLHPSSLFKREKKNVNCWIIVLYARI